MATYDQILDELMPASLLVGPNRGLLQSFSGASKFLQARDGHATTDVLDVDLPELNGYEVARQIRADADFRNTVLIALIGYGQAQDKRIAIEAGFDHHLTKPLSPERLLDILAQSDLSESERRLSLLRMPTSLRPSDSMKSLGSFVGILVLGGSFATIWHGNWSSPMGIH